LRLDKLLERRSHAARKPRYNYAFLDELTKREVRRKVLKAVSIPGHQVPFGSREMPLARGYGTGGLQLSLSLVGPRDVFKCIDQGSDASVNAVNIRNLVARMANVETTLDTHEATIIQSRHRVPEEPLRKGQILVLQVPIPEPLYLVEPRISKTVKMHAEKDYSKMWLYLYESIARHGEITVGAQYPVMVNGSYLMDPSPIPRWDVPKLHQASFLSLFGAGREKRIHAVPPYTDVEPLEFEDHRFRVESFPSGARCRRCGASDTYLNELTDATTGQTYYLCSDESFCDKRLAELGGGRG
jgi:alpha-D-ribose 1-methylphosphonate 5-phosphate C-P lyase